METQTSMKDLRNDLFRILTTEGPMALDSWLDQLPLQPTPDTVSIEIASFHSQLNLFTFLVEVEDQDMRPTVNLVLEATKHIAKCSVTDALNLCRFAQKIDPAFLFQVEGVLTGIAKDNPGLMPTLLTEMRAAELVGDSSYLVWACSYCNSSPEDAFNFLQMAKGAAELDNFIVAALFINLSSLVRKNSEIATNFSEEITARVIELSELRPDSWISWRAVCTASEFSEDAAQILQSIPSSQNIAAQMELLMWIANQDKEQLGILQIPASALMLPMISTAISDIRLRQTFDATVARLLYRVNGQAEGVKVINAFSNYSEDVTLHFNLAFHALASRPELFTKVFTQWIMGKGINAGVLRSMIRECVAGQYPCRVDDAVFQTANAQEKKRIAMRLLAWTHNAPCLSKFIENLAESPKKQPDGIGVAFVILRHMVSEYPAFTVDFLDARLSAVEKNSVAHKLYHHYHKIVLGFRNAQKELPPIAELAPTSQQQIAMHQHQVRSQRQMSKAAKAQSVIGQLAHQVTVMQGKRVASVMPDGTINISDMAEFSYTIDLPLSERADPVGGLLNRIDYIINAE